MFPILPILILLFLGPANAERLAVEGRLPAAILAVHRTHAAPARIALVAPVEDEEGIVKVSSASKRTKVFRPTVDLFHRKGTPPANPACPARAGPRTA